MKKQSSKMFSFVPTWLVITAALVLAGVVIALAMLNINRSKEHMSQILEEKGAALIKSFEAGARTGMMGMMGGGNRLQTLLSETAAQQDILYLIVTDEQGRILAHSDQDRIGSYFLDKEELGGLEPERQAQSVVLEQDGESSFMVYSTFAPLQAAPPGHMRGMHSRMHSRRAPGSQSGQARDQEIAPDSEEQTRFIFVGLDSSPFEQARQEDIRNTLLISGILLILGLSGVLTLFWLQRARLTTQLLQDAQAFSGAVVSNLPLGLLVLDREENVSYSNQPAAWLLALAGDLQGQRAKEVLPEEICNFVRRLGRERSILEQEAELHLPGEEPLPVSLSGSRIQTAAGDYAGKLVIIKDLRQIKGLQEKVKRQEKLAAIGHLAAGIAHEIRNPLSSIKGLATYFLGMSQEKSQEQSAARTMIQEVDRLNRVVTELLEFARPSELQLEQCEVNQLVRHSLGLVRRDAESKQVGIRFEPQQDQLWAYWDQDRLNQALLNLYLNAIQAMQEGGELLVQTGKQEGQIRISVSDTGAGIAQSELERIFDPYYTSKKSGTGLGLAVVDKIIQAHQGRIKVQSAPGQGSTFVLLLPVNSAEDRE
ncbi:MAG: ATP-binding protein [Desulfohalobiaceae bacterium]